MHLLCTFLRCTYIWKYHTVITPVIHFYSYIYNYPLTPNHTTKPAPNLTHIPPQYHLNAPIIPKNHNWARK